MIRSGALQRKRIWVLRSRIRQYSQRVCFYLPGQNCMIRDRDSRCFCEEMAIAANVSPTNLLWLTYPMNPTHPTTRKSRRRETTSGIIGIANRLLRRKACTVKLSWQLGTESKSIVTLMCSQSIQQKN